MEQIKAAWPPRSAGCADGRPVTRQSIGWPSCLPPTQIQEPVVDSYSTVPRPSMHICPSTAGTAACATGATAPKAANMAAAMNPINRVRIGTSDKDGGTALTSFAPHHVEARAVLLHSGDGRVPRRCKRDTAGTRVPEAFAQVRGQPGAMDDKPAVVVVGPPDDIGLRKVVIDGKTEGYVWCPHELQKVLNSAGVGPRFCIEWRGGDITVWPAQKWGRRMNGTIMAVGFMVTAVVCGWIGFHDTFDALSFSGRVTGFLFLVMAIVEAVAFAAVFDYWRKRKMRASGPALLLGASVEFLVGAVLLWMHFKYRGWSFTPHLPIWAVIMACAVYSLVVLIRRRVWKVLRYPGRIAIGAIGSTLIVITNLAYTQVYLPSISRPLVQASAELGKPSIDHNSKEMYLRVRLRLKNAGQVPVHIIGSIYWIHAKLASDPRDKYKLLKPGELVKPPGRELGPEEEISEDVVVEIKDPAKMTYEALTARVEAWVIRQDRMKISADYKESGKWRGKLVKEGKDDDPQAPPPTDREYFRYQAYISNSSELLNVTRGRERVTVWWVYSRWPAVYADISRPGEKKRFNIKDPTEQRQANERYGLKLVSGSMSQTPFTQLLKEAQDQRPK
ncbi:hypothetical protein [Streptomyces sp. NPDC090445]|uniref:hypothetical protein n=1 Tax=Streptomyces sp. NPDC090445 TaxID=3365963 RepID=UPI0037F83ADF